MELHYEYARWGCNVEKKEPPPSKNPEEDIFA
jgi:hypothetical protein